MSVLKRSIVTASRQNLILIDSHTSRTPLNKWMDALNMYVTKRQKNVITNISIEHLIVGATGLGYLIVGVLQWAKGETANGMIWTGYAFAQVGLWMNLK